MQQSTGLRETQLQSAVHVDAERAEVDLLLSSRTFTRANNLGRFLGFVCEKYFEGATLDIKEYSIAVQALGRPPEFDPQLDTVVRVTAHNLRKRLELYYASEGADHPVHICLPAGHYVPQFVHQAEVGNGRRARATEPNKTDILAEQTGSDSLFVPGEHALQISAIPDSIPLPARPGSRKAIVGTALVLACLVGSLIFYLWSHRAHPTPVTQLSSAAPIPLNLPGSEIHALVGSNRQAYLDRAGLTWQSDHFCSGGSTFSAAGHTILGTDDPQLFSSGRQGVFKCSYPVPPGSYEVHLLFAETAGMQENRRNVVFSINSASPETLDVVDDAAGDDTATTKVYTGIEPGKDGMIHVDFMWPDAFVNAIEILPNASHRMIPARIIVGHSAYRDAAGNLWLPDRYFFGGRLSWFVGDLSQVPDGSLYEWHRFGHFHYVIPVATGALYTLKLYFLEHWFGVQNGGVGGRGSRVFDVSCNGSMLLKNFDIYQEAGTAPLVKTFPHIQPTAQGKIELYFTPTVNYPSISAIAVIPE
jgi:hypothetical protein